MRGASQPHAAWCDLPQNLEVGMTSTKKTGTTCITVAPRLHGAGGGLQDVCSLDELLKMM